MAPKMTKHGLPIRFAKRSLSPAVLAKLKGEIVRLGGNGTAQGVEFAKRMFRAYPQLRGA